jgi:phage tail-like protein
MRGLIPTLPNPYPLATSLPAAFQEDTFTDRFLSVFDDLVAPILLTLDTVDAYLDPWLCPADFLPWLASWLGLELDENWSERQQRRLLSTAVELLRWRGTHRGTVELISNFLGIDADRIEIDDSGGVAWSVTPGGAFPGSSPPSLTVRVRLTETDELDRRRLERLITSSAPAHVTTRVEVVSPRTPSDADPGSRGSPTPTSEQPGEHAPTDG